MTYVQIGSGRKTGSSLRRPAIGYSAPSIHFSTGGLML